MIQFATASRLEGADPTAQVQIVTDSKVRAAFAGEAGFEYVEVEIWHEDVILPGGRMVMVLKWRLDPEDDDADENPHPAAKANIFAGSLDSLRAFIATMTAAVDLAAQVHGVDALAYKARSRTATPATSPAEVACATT